MRYSYEFKRKCVEMYRKGQWADTPVGIKESKFRNMVKRWARIETANGPDALQHKNSNKVWTPAQKLELMSLVFAGRSIIDVACSAGINAGMLYQWIQKYKTKGYNGLLSRQKGRLPKEPQMKKKKDDSNNPRPLTESDLEELIRLRSENEYSKAENEAIKKEIDLREEKHAALLKEKKQQSYKLFEKKGIK